MVQEAVNFTSKQKAVKQECLPVKRILLVKHILPVKHIGMKEAESWKRKK